MDYKYNTLSDHSLNALLQQHTSLRYSAQLELLEELKGRDFSSEIVSPLAQTLVQKREFLVSLGFMDEMGFKVTADGIKTTICRKLWPQVTEIASIIVGAILVFVGVYGVINLYNYFTGDVDGGLEVLLFNVFFTFLGFKGFQMLGGLSRFINNFGMEFSFSEANVALVKRVDLKKERFTGKSNEVTLEEREDTLELKFKDQTVLVANPKSFVQRETLKILLEKLENNQVVAPLNTTDYAM